MKSKSVSVSGSECVQDKTEHSSESVSESVRHWLVTVFISVLVVVLAIVCVKGLWQSFDAFTTNQQKFMEAYSDAAAAIAGGAVTANANLPTDNEEPSGQSESELTRSASEVIKASIDHLERLQVIQKNATTDSLMSFLYSTLTTVLIGLCFGFVVKARKYADDASLNAENAKNDAKKAKSHGAKAKEIEAEIKKVEEQATANQKKMESSYESQRNATRILNIHIGIVHFRAALVLGERITANERIFNVYTRVFELPSVVDRNELRYLRDELLKLRRPIEIFRDEENLSDDESASRSGASKQYIIWVDDAVRHCDGLIRGS